MWYYLCWALGSFHKEQAVANAVGISPGFLLKQVDGKRTCSAIWWCGDMRCWFLIQHALKLDAVHGPPWAALFWPRLATGESGDLFNIVKLLSNFTQFYFLRVLLFHGAMLQVSFKIGRYERWPTMQDRERITALCGSQPWTVLITRLHPAILIKSSARHRRFWAALALRELVVETPPDRLHLRNDMKWQFGRWKQDWL